MDEITQRTELNSALFELNLLNSSADINAKSKSFPIQNVINKRTSYIVPPNTPVKLPMQLNPRYISKIYSSPRRMPNRVPPMRMRPYYIPERPRTKSENSDPTSTLYQETTSLVDSINYTMMDTCDNLIHINENNGGELVDRNIKNRNLKILIKKSKSLEDVRVENVNGAASSHEMEFMSSRIQKLRVQD